MKNKTNSKHTQFQLIWKRFKKNKLAMFGLCVFLVLVLLAIYISIFGDYEEAITMHMDEKLLTPSAEHLLGTDHYGRDLLTRMLFGARISISISLSTIDRKSVV